MRKFFARIRRNFIIEGKLVSYRKYVIGEIVLVVISILIALQINAWNQGRMEGNKQISYLKNLNVELEEHGQNLFCPCFAVKFRSHQCSCNGL